MFLPFGKNACSALRSLRMARICVATNGAVRFSVCGSVWGCTLFCCIKGGEMDKSNDLNYMKEYLKTALELEKYRYSLSHGKQYALQQRNAASQSLDQVSGNIVSYQYKLSDDAESFIKLNSISTKTVILKFLGAFVLFLLGIGFAILVFSSSDSFNGISGVITEFVSEFKQSPFLTLLLFFAGGFPLSHALYIGSICLFFSAIKTSRKKRKLSRAYLSEQFQNEQDQINSKLDQLFSAQAATESRIISLDDNYNELANLSGQVQDDLDQLYSENVLPKEYRTIPYLATLYGYIERGRCISVKGHGGIYDTLEYDIKLNAIILGIEQVNRNLEQIKRNQIDLYYAIQEGNEITQKLCNEIQAGNRANQSLLTAISIEQQRHNAMQEWHNWNVRYALNA